MTPRCLDQPLPSPSSVLIGYLTQLPRHNDLRTRGKDLALLLMRNTSVRRFELHPIFAFKLETLQHDIFYCSWEDCDSHWRRLRSVTIDILYISHLTMARRETIE